MTSLPKLKGDKKKKTCAAYSRVEYDRSQWTSYFELDLDFIKNNSMAEPENMELQEKYDYNNPLDISNARFARTSNNEGDYVDDFGHNFNDDDDDEMPNQDFDFIDNLENDPLIEDNVNLIEAPVCAEQFKINYAKRAKNVDVRKVKRSMLNFLKDHDSEPEASKLTLLFRNARRILKPADVKDLSIHVAFVTLLDLANEQKLELANNDYFTEILVKFATSA